MNSPEVSIGIIKANLQKMQAIVNIMSGRSMFADVLPDPEPLLQNYGDRATFQDAHDKWLREQRDALASETSEGCCGES